MMSTIDHKLKWLFMYIPQSYCLESRYFSV